MSRLERFILRLKAQRNCLDAAATWLAGIDGPILELGLGSGRTYDHLRDRFPSREIFVFEQTPEAHPDYLPDPQHLIIGRLEETLPAAVSWLSAPAVLAHSDIGTHDLERDARLAAWLARTLPPLMRPDALVASDRSLASAELEPLPLPSIPQGVYFFYRKLG